jgi:hypothetical protein
MPEASCDASQTDLQKIDYCFKKAIEKNLGI